jgi:hypothetical protein
MTAESGLAAPRLMERALNQTDASEVQPGADVLPEP